MDKFTCKAKRTDNGQWVKGYVFCREGKYFIISPVCGTCEFCNTYPVDEKTICRYVGRSFGEYDVFEHDLVETFIESKVDDDFIKETLEVSIDDNSWNVHDEDNYTVRPSWLIGDLIVVGNTLD